MKKTILLLVVIFLVASVSSAFAEMKTFIKEYTYQAGEIDSKISCRIIALEQVKRLLLEEIGTYLESQTEVKNFSLTKDEITVLTAGIVRAEIVEEKWDGNNLKYWLKAKITADPSSVVTSIDSLRKDRQKMRELEITRRRSISLTTEIEQLGKELAGSNPDPSKISQYNSALKKLSASDYIEKGLFLIKEEKTDEAIEAFTTAIERDPSLGKAYSYLGGAALNNKKFHLAIDYANKAIALNSTDELAYKVRGLSYFELRHYKQAIDDVSAAINIVPKDADLYKGRGDVFMARGNYEMAVKDFSKAIGLLPNNGYLYERRAVAYEKLGNYKQAADDYYNAVSNPNELRPARTADVLSFDTINNDFSHKVDSYEKERQYNKAIDLLTREIKKDPKNVDIIVRRGDIYAQSGKHRLSVIDYTHAIKLKSNNKNSDLYFQRSKSYKTLGAYKDAISDLKTALHIESSNTTYSTIVNRESDFCVQMQKCNIVADLGSQSLNNCFEMAVSSILEAENKYCRANMNFLSKIIESQPQYASRAYCTRAFLYTHAENYQQAIEDYSKGIELDIHYPQDESIGCVGGFSGRASAYYYTGQYQRAIEDYSKDIETNQQLSSYSYSSRGDIYMKLKNYSLAIQDYTIAIENDPWQKKGYYLTVTKTYSKRGDAYREVGGYQKAIEDYTAAIDLSLKKKPVSINSRSEFSVDLSGVYEPHSGFEPIPFVSPLLYLQRGDVYALADNNLHAAKDYSKVIESDPKNAVALRKRGNIYRKLGRHKLAVDDLRLAATLGDSVAQDYLKTNEIDW